MSTHTPPKDLLEDETLSQKLIKKWFWLYFFSFLIGPAGYLIRVMISNSTSVSVADVGVLYSIISLVGFLNIYNDLGLTESLQYFLPRYRVKKEYNNIKTTIWLSLGVQMVSSILIALWLWFGADRLAVHYFHSEVAAQILHFFCIYFLGINLYQTLQSIFIAFQKTYDYKLVDFIQIRAIVAFTIFFFFTARQTILWYSLNWVLGLGVGILIAWILYRKKYHKQLMQGRFEWNKPALNEYKTYALWSFLGVNIGVVFWQLTQQLVIYFLGAEQAWFFANFLSLSNISVVLISPIIGLIFPMVSEMVGKKETKKLETLFGFFYTFFSIFALSLAVFLIVLGPEVALVLFWKKFIFSGHLLTIWSIFSVFIILTNFNFSVLAGMGKIKQRVAIMGIATLFLLGASLISMKIAGTYGAVLAFGLSYLLLWILSWRLLRKDISISVNRRFIIKNIIILVLMGAILLLIKWDIFVLDDLQRYSNFGKMVILWLIFYSIFVGFNYKKFMLLKEEVKKLRG